ncbi:hypothetical protein A2852_02765 [Candidatus Adlerbacteria bacterium RIFCSPHIGHO2_01_FULL_54_23]|uniref:GH18 domain-containing protein n=3 Tax=Candidatus Adleribacteriota TaxID=1752736 RepID=A0A1F4XZN3_9BACT|nr:MAG: hypothetical protein UY83_C0006G0026 [Candidatus Adlerbacteria bacterium GW2011_GWA1_54_10]KKW37690.1 MAG: hypothetical protein UY86_C0004G0019 [Candidatus Adlerbacteria bacterium GW2011_GWB1_54_7]OGC79514.1 MAG: hypothetical protein A2852_02765 [Candidatus Adlerbacteria bacterium RIFCSPHIGHO2_01_FULL_54_23]OGC87162.1 MAG: hypothetical protein A3B33_01125 [Candidatus Adlerbacteria bacterium RIFCSPLOWO2_01_FULL_54_16]
MRRAFFAAVFILLFPFPVLAQYKPFEFSGWIPYWKSEAGVAEARAHLRELTEINPFGYSIKADGTLQDLAGLDKEYWQTLFADARVGKVRIIPTAMWSDGAQMDKLLRDPEWRKNHIQNLYDLVTQNNFDGIDIDYEGKWAETRVYFSAFLQELYKKMGNKWVMCTIEPRTPLEARYDTVPKNIEYANDFKVLNKNCDRVRIMTYDQGTIDIRLNRAQNGKPYIPLSDPKWVEKVIQLAAKDISKKKIVIGVGTYGYEYAITPQSSSYVYDKQWSLSPAYALDLARQLNLTPQRNSAGEMSFTYLPALAGQINAAQTLPNPEPFNLSTSTTPQAAAVALAFEKIRIIWWSDAQAIKQKVNLARKLGVRGVAIFKLDGSADPQTWSVLK